MESVSRKLAELLLKDRILLPQHMAEMDRLAQAGRNPVRAFIESGIISESKLVLYLSQKFSIPNINLAKFELRPELARLVPAEVARRLQAVPVQSAKGSLVVAIADPTGLALVLDDLKARTKSNVEAVLTTYSALEQAIDKLYSGTASMGSAIASFQREEASQAAASPSTEVELVDIHDIDSQSSAQDAPVITLVNGVLSEAIRLGASDIHVEPYEKRFRVRLRIDGTLQEVAQIPTEMRRAVIARFKIMSRMDIAESRVPQDGRIKLRTGGKDIDFRVSSLPTLFGEKVVARLLSQGNLQLDLLKLGFEPKQLETFKRGLYAPNGMVLVTGPTGSGKTTTLYSGLSELNKVSDNISTVEDPVEYNLEGVNQTQVNKDIGFTFASVLRALLRQDPDIILVGEIRDYETAEVAIQAALTGHLVLSTLHTNDAASTIVRLVNMGVEPFLVVAAVNTIVAQRLLRKLCDRCRQEKAATHEQLAPLGLGADVLRTAKFYGPKGCSHCHKSGYKGRVAVYEVMELSPALKERILHGDSSAELKKIALKEGMMTLRQSAIRKAAEGVTSLEEALSLTMET